MFTEINRVKIRKYLGFAAIFHQAEPRLENAIGAVQSVADGGNRPDNSTELFILDLLTQLDAIDQQLIDMLQCLGTNQVGKIATDNVRAYLVVQMRGRQVVGYLADALSTRPIRDVFSAPQTSNDSDGVFYGPGEVHA